MTTAVRSIGDRAAELAESWINGNRDEVAQELEGAGVDGAALILALLDGDRVGASLSSDDVLILTGYMLRRAEQRAYVDEDDDWWWWQ